MLYDMYILNDCIQDVTEMISSGKGVWSNNWIYVNYDVNLTCSVKLGGLRKLSNFCIDLLVSKFYAHFELFLEMPLD